MDPLNDIDTISTFDRQPHRLGAIARTALCTRVTQASRGKIGQCLANLPAIYSRTIWLRRFFRAPPCLVVVTSNWPLLYSMCRFNIIITRRIKITSQAFTTWRGTPWRRRAAIVYLLAHCQRHARYHCSAADTRHRKTSATTKRPTEDGKNATERRPEARGTPTPPAAASSCHHSPSGVPRSSFFEGGGLNSTGVAGVSQVI